MGFLNRLVSWLSGDEPAPRSPEPGSPAQSRYGPSGMRAENRVVAPEPGSPAQSRYGPSGTQAGNRFGRGDGGPVQPVPRYDPALASRPTQRYLKEVGWDGTYSTPSQTAEGFGLTDLADLPQHTYSLSPWQMQQAANDYGFDAPGERVALTSDRARTGRMDEAAFAALTPAQQNAVRFNQMLMDAVASDRALRAPESRGDYDRRAAEMFGTQGVSQMYAPNTLALLEELGMGQLRNQDLDEYLSLDRAYDVDEIRNLQTWEGPAPEYLNRGFGGSRTQEASLGLDMRQVERAGALLDEVRADPALSGWNDMSRLNSRLGLPLAPGWATSFRTKEEVLEDESAPAWEQVSALYWENFRDREFDPQLMLEQFWADADAMGLSEQDVKLVFDDLFQRSFVMPGGDDAFRSGEELRAALGLGG